ncbi:MAG: TIGR02757 family protein [Sphingobacteriia bacterium]|nr:TIGR02757 family protein [Sphingobacteriia bacterium]
MQSFLQDPNELKSFLDEKVDFYNRTFFIESDPISIPHAYSKKEDIEIAAFLVATISWGNRKMIVKNGFKMMRLMGESPFDFVMCHSEDDLQRLNGFVHRTFNSDDYKVFIRGLRHCYLQYGGLESIFRQYALPETLQPAISQFKKFFFEQSIETRSLRHLSDPLAGSAAKRINMMLRWLVRDDQRGVDFGIWKSISPSQLSCPLDLHSGNVARLLGLLVRKQNDAKAVKELDDCLRSFDSVDPVKYDFALFGLGVFEGFR